MNKITENQKGFIDFLVASGALTFGDFTTKSGRKTPYFINTGRFDDGAKISALGKFYAQHIVDNRLDDATIIFGPAYKGIPLCVTTAAALSMSHNKTVGFSFDRKEIKTHGDGGKIVGKKIADGDKILLVEDVITAGTTMREVVPMLNTLAKIELRGVVIAVDRCEKGSGTLSAVQETEQELGVKVFPILTIHQIVSYLEQSNGSGLTLSGQLRESISSYLGAYGA